MQTVSSPSATPLDRGVLALDPALTYLNHAAVGILPIATRDAVHGFVDAHAARGVLGTWRYEAALPQYRAAIGALIGVGGSEIAVLRNTGDGANVIALGLDWEPGDEIIIGDNEFGSNAYPWLALRERGVVVRFVETARERMTPEVLARLVSSRTRLVAVSWVSFADGYRHDLAALAEIAHRAGAWFVVDAIQGLGAFPLDARACACDAVYAGGAKWLMSLQGVSFLYVAPGLLERLALRIPGWRSVADMWNFLDYEQAPAAAVARFEGGTPNFVGALSLAQSVAVLMNAGIERIAAHVLAITDELVDGLHSKGATVASIRDGETRSGIVTFELPGRDPIELGGRLQRAGFVTTYRRNGIRVSPHGYTRIEEIRAFVDSL